MQSHSIKKFIHINLLASWLLIAILFTAYYSTLARSIYLEDSAEFVTAAATLSIPHPSGYPLYILTSKLLTFILPLGDLTFTVNFISAFWTILAALFLYFALLRLAKSPGIAFSLALLFGLSPMVWQQATYAEVYSLNTFMLALLAWLWVLFPADKKNKRLKILAFVYGLSLSNHYLPLFLAPLILFWLLKNRPGWRNLKLHGSLVIFFLLGLAPYLYLPIRSAMRPAFDWFGSEGGKFLFYNIAYGHSLSGATGRYLGDLGLFAWNALGPDGILLLLIGLGLAVWRKNWWLVSALFLSSFGLLVALTGGQEYNNFAAWFYQFLYVPFLLIALFPLALVLKKIKKGLFLYLTLFLLLVWPAYKLGDNWLANNRSGYSFLENYSAALTRSLPENAALFTYHNHIMTDPIVFSLAWQKYLENSRPDVKIYSLNPVWLPPADFPLAELKNYKNAQILFKKYLASLSDKKNVFTTFPWSEEDGNKNQGLGLVYSLDEASADRRIIFTPPNLEFPAGAGNPYHFSLLAKYYYDQAAYYFEQGRQKSGQWFLIQAISYDPDGFSDYYRDITRYRDNLSRQN